MDINELPWAIFLVFQHLKHRHLFQNITIILYFYLEMFKFLKKCGFKNISDWKQRRVYFFSLWQKLKFTYQLSIFGKDTVFTPSGGLTPYSFQNHQPLWLCAISWQN